MNREQLLEAIMNAYDVRPSSAIMIDKIVETIVAIANTEYAKGQVHRTGRWLHNEHTDIFECSICGCQMARNIFGYCPWCGADMKGERDEVDT